MSELVGNTPKPSCSGASFLINPIDRDYELCLLDELKICDLPFEVLDLILSKVVLWRMYFEDKANRPTNRCVFIGLASVSGLWSEIIKRRRFKMSVKGLLAVYFRKAKKRSTIIDHNYEFLKDVLQPDILIDQLDLTGCLKRNQISSLKRIRRVKDKNDELIFLLRNFNSKNYSQFVQCLCSTDQNNAARVLEHGGETVKVHISNRNDFQTGELEISFATKLLEQPKEYDQYWNYIGLPYDQRLKDVSVLHAKQDQGITIWLWFQTEDAWNKIKANSKDVLLEIVRKLFKRLMLKSTIASHDVQLQYINSTNEFAKRKLLFQAKRGSQIKGEAERVVVLKDKIYATLKRSILVYKNEVPYPQFPEIRLPDTTSGNRYGTPLQIAVCQMHNCLYAADKDTQCIYKIEPMHDHRMTKWLKEAGSLFVATTCSGDVLVLRRETGANSLRVLRKDGVLIHDISLGDDFYQEVEIVREIAPNVIALIYSKHVDTSPYCISTLFTMRLNRLGSIDPKHSWGRSINCLFPFSSCQLLVGISHNNEGRYLIGLYDCHLWSIQIQDIILKFAIPIDIYFSADQKELFVLTAGKTTYSLDAQRRYADLLESLGNMDGTFSRVSNSKHRFYTDKNSRHLAEKEEICKIEIYKMNYEDENYD